MICDLRTSAERRTAPTAWQGGPAPQFLATQPDTAATAAAPPGKPVQTGSAARATDEQLRQRIENIEAGREIHEFDIRYPDLARAQTGAYKAIFARLASGELPSLTHCTAGQDRTGVFAAVLLLALGVPRDTVTEDYLLTNQYRRPDEYIEQVRRDIQQRLRLPGLPSFETVRWMEDNHSSNLDKALTALAADYGSFEAYLQKGLDLTPARLAQLKSRLLED
jgi:protein-tyrosine phosphatase